MKNLFIKLSLILILGIGREAHAQFKSHVETKFRGFGLVYNTINVNGNIGFKYVDSMPFASDPIASMDRYEYTKNDGSILFTEKDPAWLGISGHFGNKLENQRKYIQYGFALMRYSTDRYNVQMLNFYREPGGANKSNDAELYNGSINYKESAYLLNVKFGYYVESPPVISNQKLYFFAGISPQISYSFARSAHQVLDYSVINLRTGEKKMVNQDRTESGMNFLTAQIGPEMGAEFLLNELSSVKLMLSPSIGLSNANNLRASNNFFDFSFTQSFSLGLNYVHYFRD